MLKVANSQFSPHVLQWPSQAGPPLKIVALDNSAAIEHQMQTAPRPLIYVGPSHDQQPPRRRGERVVARVSVACLTLSHEIILEFYFTCHKLRLNNNSSLYIKGKTNHPTMNWSTGKLLQFTKFLLFYFFTQLYQCFITKLVRTVRCHKA